MPRRQSSKTSATGRQSSKTSVCAYGVLGVDGSADPAEIRRAYLKLALQLHPDKSAPEARGRQQKLFQELVGAYDKVKDADQRSAYDKRRSSSAGTLERARHEAKINCPKTAERPSCSAAARRFCRQQSDSNLHNWITKEPSYGMTTTATEQLRHYSGFSMAPTLVQLETPGMRPHTAPEGQHQARRFQHHPPPSSRVTFDAGCALIGHRQIENGVCGSASEAATAAQLRAMAQWILFNSAGTLLEVRGCSLPGEVAPSQAEALSLARSHNTLEFLCNSCMVPGERCRVSNCQGSAYRGVELRLLRPIAICAFQVNSLELEGVKPTLDAVTANLSGGSMQRLFLEVRFPSSHRMAQRRLAAVMGSLVNHGISRKSFRGQVRPGLADECHFYAYEELPSSSRPC